MPDQPLHFPSELPSEREAIHASILKSRLDLQRLQSDLHDTISLNREMGLDRCPFLADDAY